MKKSVQDKGTGARSSYHRVPSLDGWRALSIVLVLAEHTKHTANFPASLDLIQKWLFDANLGVRCFFVISGLVITVLLLREWRINNGIISLGDFYIRRILRIIPVYLVFLLFVFLLTQVTALSIPLRDWLADLTFTTNFFPSSFVTGHLWSLSVEEQFYLLWPLALIGILSRRSPLLFGSICLLSVAVIAPVSRVVSYVHRADGYANPIYSPFSFFNYFDSIAAGCGCAFLIFFKPDWMSKVKANWIPISLTGTLLVICPHVLSRLFLAGKLTVPFSPSMQAVGLSLVILASVTNPGGIPFKILNTRAVIIVGILSYSLYIWQQPFCTKTAAFGLSNLSWLTFKTWLIPVFGTAVVSYYALERPFIELRRRLQHARHGTEVFGNNLLGHRRLSG